MILCEYDHYKNWKVKVNIVIFLANKAEYRKLRKSGIKRKMENSCAYSLRFLIGARSSFQFCSKRKPARNSLHIRNSDWFYQI